MDILGYDRVDDYGADTNFAGEIAVNGSNTGVINYNGDQDWFRVYLNAGTHYRFNENGVDSGQGTLDDPYMRLYNSSGQLLAQDDDNGVSNDAELIFTPTASGNYTSMQRATAAAPELTRSVRRSGRRRPISILTPTPMWFGGTIPEHSRCGSSTD